MDAKTPNPYLLMHAAAHAPILSTMANATGSDSRLEDSIIVLAEAMRDWPAISPYTLGGIGY
jgi:hypothetical protein